MCMNKEGTCRCKEICAKLQEAGLREGLKELSAVRYDTRRSDTIQILGSIQNILEEYDCTLCDSLKNRIEYLKQYLIGNGSDSYTTFGGISAIKILSKEIEAFLEIDKA